MSSSVIAAVAFAVLMAIAATILWLRARLVVVTVEGISMAPTLAPSDRVIVRRVALARLRAGQVVVLERPYLEGGVWVWPSTTGGIRSRSWIIKRIAAIAGEPVPMGVPSAARAQDPIVPSGYVIVLGDNIDTSTDSRRIGYIPTERVLGVALRRHGTRDPITTDHGIKVGCPDVAVLTPLRCNG